MIFLVLVAAWLIGVIYLGALLDGDSPRKPPGTIEWEYRG